MGFAPVSSGDRPFAFGTGDFIIDTFVRSTGHGCYGTQYLSAGVYTSSNNLWERSWGIDTTSDGKVSFRVFNDRVGSTEPAQFSLTSPSVAVPVDTWVHLGVSRKAGVIRLFVNGSKVAEGSFSGAIERTKYQADLGLFLGKAPTGGNGCSSGDHYFDNTRIVKGYGVTSLPVPTAPYVP